MARHPVARAGEIGPGQPKMVCIDGKEIGVFYEGEQYFAVLNYCPHFGAPICQGHVFGAVLADEPGKQFYDASRPILRCPWHRWEFDMQTGKALTPIKQRIKTFPVQVEETEDDTEDGRAENAAPETPEVTTFPVRLEGEIISIEV